MKVFVDDNKIKVRREGIFLCLDGSITIDLVERIVTFVRHQCNDFNIPMKIGFLSWPQEISGSPDHDFIVSKNLTHRGRFITPLVETIFPDLIEKHFDLLLIAHDTIHDIVDWQEEIESKFNRIYKYNARMLETMTPIEMEKQLLLDVFSFKIDEIKLDFEDSLCYEFPADFRLKVDNGNFVYHSLCGSRSADIELKTCSPRREANVKIGLAREELAVKLKATNPEVVTISTRLKESRQFLDFLDSYRRKVFEHECPICRARHKFSRAFVCNQHKKPGELFGSKWRLIFDDVEAERSTNVNSVVFSIKEDMLFFQIVNTPIVCVGAREFIAASEDNRMYHVKVTDHMQISELPEIHKGLFYHPDHIFVLSLR